MAVLDSTCLPLREPADSKLKGPLAIA